MKTTNHNEYLIQHLLRRAGFGYNQMDLDFFQNLGYGPSVDYLLYPDPHNDNDLNDILSKENFDFTNIENVKRWWLMKMAFTKNPLQEKITLFWHGHFATSNAKVNQTPLMYFQNQTFRNKGLSHFKDLLQAMLYDPAMIRWLDNQENNVGKPNENFSREVMELFTLGIGHYTEEDVKQGARAFTGYHSRGFNFYFDKNQHDYGEKIYLEQTGKFNGNDIVKILANQPQCANFIAYKLCKFFASDKPSNSLVNDLALTYKKNNGNITTMLYTLFNHDEFKSPVCYRNKIKSPVEYAIGTIKTLEKKKITSDLPKYLASMGQDLFYPPSVKGWDGGTAWIASDTLLARYNFANQIIQNKMDNLENDYILPTILIKKYNLNTSNDLISYFSELFIDNDMNPDIHQSFCNYLNDNDNNNDIINFTSWDDLKLDAKLRGIIHLFLTSPMYNIA